MILLKKYDYIVFYDNFLNDQEIALIQEHVANKTSEQGEIFTDNDDQVVVPKVRNSLVKWIEPVKEVEWLSKKIYELIFDANNNFFHMELSECSNLQHTTYEAPSGHYRAHIDAFFNTSLPRKISFTIQLSDEKQYDGGDLLIYHSDFDKPKKAPRKKGSVTVFFSMFIHQVTPVTRGTRHSLVGWVSGPPLK